MTAAFSARRTARGWRVRRAETGDWKVSDAEIGRFTADGNRSLGAALDRAAVADEAIRLDLEKTLFVHGMTALGVAAAFAARCRAAPERTHSLEGPARDVDRLAIMSALASGGEPVEGLGLARLTAALAFLPAAGLALALWLLTALRLGGGDALPDADVVYALHPEATNRANHLLNALAAAEPDAPVLLLGRPTGPVRAARAFLASRGLKPRAVARPWTFGDALATLPAWLGRLPALALAMTAAGVRPPFGEQSAIAFRLAIGLASARWARRRPTSARTVIYGHCGRADTVLLERAQQAADVRTVHWLHGLSAGRIYRGVSDVLVTQCGHDARWHEALGGYAACAAVPSDRPAFRTGETPGWVVLTNFVHPAHPTWATHGLRDELDLLDLVGSAADAAALPRGQVLWKPHPVVYAMDAAVLADLEAAVAARGFALWPREDREFARIARTAVVLSTPSGAAVDVLKLGRLPVIAAPRAIDPDHVLARFPLVAGDPAGLAAAMATAADPALSQALFGKAWDAVAPGAAPTLVQLAEIASGEPVGHRPPRARRVRSDAR